MSLKNTGFSTRTDEDGFISVGHGGSVAGYNASMVFHPESKIGAMINIGSRRGLWMIL